MRAAKAYLSRYPKLKQYIKARQSELGELRNSLIPSSVDYTGITVQTSPHDKMADIMAQIDQLERRITEVTLAAMTALGEIEDTVNKLEDPRQQALIIYHYINDLTWEECAEAMGYDLRWIYRLHGRALDEVEKIIGH